jgi:hypothetical protein
MRQPRARPGFVPCAHPCSDSDAVRCAPVPPGAKRSLVFLSVRVLLTPRALPRPHLPNARVRWRLRGLRLTREGLWCAETKCQGRGQSPRGGA